MVESACRAADPSPTGPAGTGTAISLPKVTRPRRSTGPQPADQGVERLERGEQAPVGHRGAPVDHDLERGRRPGDGGRAFGRGELEQRVNRVLALDRDQVVFKIELCSHGH